MTTTQTWFYTANGQQYGPVDEPTISALIADRSIDAQTLLWTEGMQGWRRADELTRWVDDIANAPPAPPRVAEAHDAASATPLPLAPKASRTLWLWFTWLMACAFPLLVVGGVFLGIAAAMARHGGGGAAIVVATFFTMLPLAGLVAAVILGYVMLFRFWSAISGKWARTTPGKGVGFLFIPFFNLYWLFIAYVGLANDMNTYCRKQGVPAAGYVSSGLAISVCVLTLCTAIPYLSMFIGIPLVICEIVLFKQLTDTSAAIIQYRNQKPDA